MRALHEDPGAMLDARAAEFAVKDTHILGPVDLSVAAGEFVAVVGPNGAGKSTLLRILSGEITPVAGEVVLGGHRLRDLDFHERALLRGVLRPGFNPDVALTARSVVELGRHPHRRDPATSAEDDVHAVTSAMVATDCADLAGRLFNTLSSGEQARVTLARVLAQDTPVVLLDEPTRALDVGHVERVMGVLAARADARGAVVSVLHDLNAAARHASRVVLVVDGTIVADGTADEVLTVDLLTAAYGHPVRVVPHPFRPGLLVLVE